MPVLKVKKRAKKDIYTMTHTYIFTRKMVSICQRASSFLNLCNRYKVKMQMLSKKKYGFCQYEGITHCLNHKRSYQSLNNRSFCS